MQQDIRDCTTDSLHRERRRLEQGRILRPEDFSEVERERLAVVKAELDRRLLAPRSVNVSTSV